MAENWIIGTGFSRGIGFEFAKKIQKEGYKFIHLGRTPTGFENEFLKWDLSLPIIKNSVSQLREIMSGKNMIGFFYGAGVMPMFEIGPDEKTLFWQNQEHAMRVNYFSCAELVEEIFPFLAAPKAETDVPFIAHLSSLAAVNPFPGLELYGGTKAAALHYFTWLSKRFDAEKITCLSIHPGTVQTDMTMNVIQNEKKELALVKLLSQMKNQKSMILPEESASKIFDFIFNSFSSRKKFHGKMFEVK